MVEYNPETPPPPAPDYPPENAFDVQSFVAQGFAKLRELGVAVADPDIKSSQDADGFMKALAALLGSKDAILAKIVEGSEEVLMTVMKVIIGVFVAVTEPLRDTLGTLTKAYVNDLVRGTGQLGVSISGRPGGIAGGAEGMFDGILAPLAGISGQYIDPTREGAGNANAQYALGAVIQLHLETWVMDILARAAGTLFAGLGFNPLGWIHSFDQVITSAINSRAINRIALRPYLDKYMAQPLERDLNLKWPLEISSPSTLLKTYLRGGISRDELLDKLRRKGFAEEISAQLLLDAATTLDSGTIKWMVNMEFWTREEAQRYLTHKGVPEEFASVALEYILSSVWRSNMDTYADSVVSAVADHLLDPEKARDLIKSAGYTDDEVQSYMVRAGFLAEKGRRLSYSQVRALYQESLVDLDYVLKWLTEEQYSDSDADMLVLLEFARKEEREQIKAQLLERRRISLLAALGEKDAANAARREELAALG